MKRDPKWDDVIFKLSPLPAKDGVYLAHENCPQTYTDAITITPQCSPRLACCPATGQTAKPCAARSIKR